MALWLPGCLAGPVPSVPMRAWGVLGIAGHPPPSRPLRAQAPGRFGPCHATVAWGAAHPPPPPSAPPAHWHFAHRAQHRQLDLTRRVKRRLMRTSQARARFAGLAASLACYECELAVDRTRRMALSPIGAQVVPAR